MLMYVLGVLAIAVGIGASIALHEIGHLVPAKRFGVKCPQYMIGFGPTLWKTTRGGTEYGLKAIPLGGFVKMIGMYPPKPGEPATQAPPARFGRWAAMIDEARQASMEEVLPGDEDRVFYKLSTPKKLAVMLGGPLMNLLIATALIAGVVTLYGQQVPVDGARVGAVVQCVKPVSATAGGDSCGPDDPLSPAAAAGLKPGDVIVSVDGRAIRDSAEITQLVRPAAGRPVPFEIRRGDAPMTLTITPIPNQVVRLDAEGKPVARADGSYETTTAGYVGTSTAQLTERQRQPLSVVPGTIWQGVTQTARIVLVLPQKVSEIAVATVTDKERPADGPMSVVGVGRVAGDVASTMTFQGVSLDGPLELAIILLLLLASLNLALFVFNLIPLLPLDGGHALGALWEGAKRTFARVTGRPDPGYVDVARSLPLVYVVSALLIGMSVVLIYADIVKPVRL